MSMSLGDVFIFEAEDALATLSFIKSPSLSMKETAACWLIEQLESMTAHLDQNNLTTIVALLESAWIELTELEAEDEIKNFDQCTLSAPILNGLVHHLGPNSELPDGISWHQTDNGHHQLKITDHIRVKSLICDRHDEIYPTPLERFELIRDHAPGGWTYTTDFGDEAEFYEFEVAAIVATQMVSLYLQPLIMRHEHQMEGTIAYDLDSAHRAHFLAHLLKTEELHNQEITKMWLLTRQFNSVHLQAAA